MNPAHDLLLRSPENLAAYEQQSAARVDWTHLGEMGHAVQFYESDAFLLKTVNAFLSSGWEMGDSVIVIATLIHLRVLEERWGKDGYDLTALERQGLYIPLDASHILSQVIIGGTPDENLFAQVIGGIVSEARQHGRRVRAFGEMVALLMSEGNAEAALQLEELWNNLARTHSFSLLCAYPINSFRGEGNSSSLLHVCNAHARVMPAESYAGKSDPDDQRRAVTLLQQQASSLESEIAERKHAQALLQAEETKLNLAVALAQLGLWEFDMETRSLIGSDLCKAHLGLNPEETLTCERFFELVHPEDRAGVRSALQAAVDDRADYKAEYRVMDAAGHVRWISAMGRCVQNGTPRLLGVIRDITEQKQAAELLERTVAERTAQLRETVGELEAFSYSISHDMRSPLRAMEGYAKALLEDYGSKLDGPAVLYLERIKRSSSRLDLLIRDILSHSKVAKGAIELKPIALTPLVDDLIHQRPEFDRVRGSILVEKPLHAVLGHEAYLTQILTNLIGNALKFIAPGTVPEVRIRSELSGEKVRVSVIDNGIGIHPDHHNRIFQIFGRVYSEKSYEGTGIGLAIVKKAVARMGGETGFQSVLGRGSDFWFLLRGADNGC